MLNSITGKKNQIYLNHKIYIINMEIIIGPMFSGKSTRLLENLSKYKKALLIRHNIDNRYGDIITHDGKSASDYTMESTGHLIDVITTDKLFDINLDIINDYSVIGIDESQFFKDLELFCTYIYKSSIYNIDIIIAGLTSDYNRKKFGQTLELIPIADNIITLKAICYNCGKSAAFSKNILNGLENSTNILIGSSDIYQPCCNNCFKL